MSSLDWGLFGAAAVTTVIALWAFHKGRNWIYNVFRVLTHILSGGASLGTFEKPKHKKNSDTQ